MVDMLRCHVINYGVLIATRQPAVWDQAHFKL
jgi:hypothetical protein